MRIWTQIYSKVRLRTERTVCKYVASLICGATVFLIAYAFQAAHWSHKAFVRTGRNEQYLLRTAILRTSEQHMFVMCNKSRACRNMHLVYRISHTKSVIPIICYAKFALFGALDWPRLADALLATTSGSARFVQMHCAFQCAPRSGARPAAPAEFSSPCSKGDPDCATRSH